MRTLLPLPSRESQLPAHDRSLSLPEGPWAEVAGPKVVSGHHGVAHSPRRGSGQLQPEVHVLVGIPEVVA